MIAAAEAIVVLLMASAAILGVLLPLIGQGGFGLVSSGPLAGQIPSIDVTLNSTVRLDPAPPDLAATSGPLQPGHALEIERPYHARATVWGLDWHQRLGLTGPGVLVALLALGVLFLLWLILRSLHLGDPFRPRNIRLIQAIAALVGIGGQAAVLLAVWGRVQILSDPHVSAYVVQDVQYSLMPLIAAVGILAIAEIFRRGRRLRDDVEGLV